jgi:hypothetical protein
VNARVFYTTQPLREPRTYDVSVQFTAPSGSRHILPNGNFVVVIGVDRDDPQGAAAMT